MISIAQCRAARGLLDWTQQDLAEASGLSKTAINNFEKGHSDIKNESLRAIRMAFESADIEFLADGLRKKNETTRIIKGPNAFNDLFNDICEALKEDKDKNGAGEILIAWIDEDLQERLPPAKFMEHLVHMKNLKITARILCQPDSMAQLSRLSAECRCLESSSLKSSMMTVVYGSKVALGLWNNSMIVILSSPDAYQAEKLRFESLWITARAAGSSMTSHSAVGFQGKT